MGERADQSAADADLHAVVVRGRGARRAFPIPPDMYGRLGHGHRIGRRDPAGECGRPMPVTDGVADSRRGGGCRRNVVLVCSWQGFGVLAEGHGPFVGPRLVASMPP
ncbi:hypothetical protein AB0I90_15265 [Micromonospora wenchangensis]|uniref:hypothetical protein n=1 Tax=Micromonospora wenchangensis TaxID=1185415 RepID=UPI0033CE8CF4